MRKRKNTWTIEQIDILKKQYIDIDRQILLNLLQPFSWHQILQQANKLNLRRPHKLEPFNHLIEPMMNISGVYTITNTLNNKKYFGSSINVGYRLKTHISKLEHQKHKNQMLQKDWNKNKDKFIFELIYKSTDMTKCTLHEYNLILKYPNQQLYNKNRYQTIQLLPKDKVRFWKKINPNDIKNVDKCWIWQGKLNRDGYGDFNIQNKNKKTHLTAHRVSYFIHNGNLPLGLSILHKCNVRSCINPNHLYIGTDADNGKDKSKHNRSRKSQFNQQQMDKIKEMKSNGLTLETIAKIYDVSTGCIYTITHDKIKPNNQP